MTLRVVINIDFDPKQDKYESTQTSYFKGIIWRLMYVIFFNPGIKGSGISICNQINNLHGPHQVHILYTMQLWVSNLVLYIVLCQRQYRNLFIFVIDDQNTMYVFANKVTRVACLNQIFINIKVHQSIQLIIVRILDATKTREAIRENLKR